jgi:BirA family biotin operon repressor/biotin-[acetyl-CoA-carboxylase] ligase
VSLQPAEALVAALVARPEGLSASAARTAASRDVLAVLAELARRGHALQRTADAVRLTCAEHHFDPARFDAARRGTLGSPLEVWERTASTNDLARAGAERGTPPGAGWLAEEQTQGRGRQGRVWECAPHQGLLFSFVVRAALDAGALPTLLPLAIGLGTCEALRAASDLDVRTKWPNDLWLDGRKLGGILVEARPGTSGFAVVGLGLNCGPGAVRAARLPQATALTGALRREALLAGILAGIERRLDDWRAARFAALRAGWSELDCVLGARVRIESGAETCAGRAVAITDAGLLRLELDGGARRDVAAGEVHLV